MNKNIGDRIDVRASQFLGTAQTKGEIKDIVRPKMGPGYYEVLCDDNSGLCYVDEEGYILDSSPWDGTMCRQV